MTEPLDMRVGDAEREDALRALGEHMSAGRLDLEEYGERSAKVSTTKTRRDLLALFTDLPEPRPKFAGPVVPQPARQDAAPPARGWEARPLPQRLYAALIPFSAIFAVVLFLTVAKGVWFVFLIPAAVTVIGGSLWGEDWARDRRDWRRDRRRGRYRD